MSEIRVRISKMMPQSDKDDIQGSKLGLAIRLQQVTSFPSTLLLSP
jgi:hypothetical protein